MKLNLVLKTKAFIVPSSIFACLPKFYTFLNPLTP